MHLYPRTYYATRFALIIPGYLLNHLLPALPANYILHLLIWFAAVAGAYLTVKNLADRRTALLTLVVMGFYPYLWKAIGWDYPDGIGIAYYLLTAASLTVASGRQKPPRLFLFLAGVTCAAAIYSNLAWTFLAPCFIPYWFFLRKARGFPFAVPRFTLFSAIGCAGLTLLFGIVSHSWQGFYWFYGASIRYALAAPGHPSPYKAKDASWVLHAPWLYLAPAVLITGLVACVTARFKLGSSQRLIVYAVYGNLLFCAAVLTVWELDGNPVLEIFYYASYLLAPSFLLLGTWNLSVPSHLSRDGFWTLISSASIFLALPWWDKWGEMWHWLFAWGPAPALFLAGLALTLGGAFRGKTWAVLLSVFGVGIFALNSRVMPLIWERPDKTEDAFVRIVKAQDLCERNRHGEKIWFWMDRKDKNAKEFSSIASGYFYGYALWNLDFPSFHSAPPLGLTAILSSDPDALERALRTLKSNGYAGEVVSQDVVERAQVRYAVILMDIEEAMDLSQPGGYVKNGDFELETRDWSGGWADLRNVASGVSGNCLELNGKYGGQQYALEALPRLRPGMRYEFSFWVKSGTSGDESFEVGLWDAISTRWVLSQTGRSSSQWTKYSLNYTTDTSDRLSVELMKNSPTKGSMLFDSVHLIPRP